MDFSMQNTLGGDVENEDDLQVMADKVVQEDSEELIFEETEADSEVKDEEVTHDDNSFTILGFTLERTHFLILMGLLVLVVAFFFKDTLADLVDGSSLSNLFSSSSEPVAEVEPVREQ